MQRARTKFRWTAFGAAILLAGCTSTRPSANAKADMGNHVVTGEREIVQAKHSSNLPGSPVAHDGLAAAEEAFKAKDYGKAEDMFADIADDTKNRPEVAERARFYQAECLRLQDYYPKAVDTYNKLLQDFPAGLYREQAVGQMYGIARFWLEPVQEEIEDAPKPEADRRKRSWTEGWAVLNFDKRLPTVGREERAMQTLEKAYYGDPTGPHADKALFMLGRVHYHRERRREAADYFQQLAEKHDRSPLRDEALKLAIISRTNSTGGAKYDGKDAAAAMRLINNARATSPQLVKEHGKLLDEQALAVRMQQAEKDFKVGETYRRIGRPGSAWYQYELVKRRYPGIEPWYGRAEARQKELQAKLDEMQNPTVFGRTQRFWEEYVLGHDIKVVKPPAGNEIKELPESRPQTLPASATAAPGTVTVPGEIRPR